ncbi:MAG: hypothetical protein KDD89_14060, partial [Anaerolineales bacterium]|nr:hypothetical protein [Anaerolineales bacterium]
RDELTAEKTTHTASASAFGSNYATGATWPNGTPRVYPSASPKIIDFVKTRGFLPSPVLRYLESTNNQNEQDQSIIAALVSRGLTPEQVKGVFMAHPCGAGLSRKREPDFYLDLSIQNAQRVSVKLFKIGNAPAEVSAW